MKKIIITKSERETFQLAKNLGQQAKQGDLFALYGDLGTGKTIMAKGIAQGLGITEEITSPTFNLLEIYKGKLPLYHFDLYRLEKAEELDHLFFEEYWEGDGVSVVEWPQKAENLFPAQIIKIFLTHLDDNSRRIVIEYFSL